ncbi:MAG: hypothetical protein CMA64_09515 [Euryarchaeota archaeon]|nr:hypothetical protein [Euryarchaeota archaeon]
MKINEIDNVKSYSKGSYKLSGGITGKGGQIGEVIDMTTRHYKAWKDVIAKHSDHAKSNPAGLLQAWIDRFYGSSSAKISYKKASTEFGVDTDKKGANAILRIVIAIMLKPKSSVEMQSYIEQVQDKLPNDISKEVSENMPAPQGDPEPAAAQNQGSNIAKGTLKKASDGAPYEWAGAQWINLKTGRMASKQISAELGK